MKLLFCQSIFAVFFVGMNTHAQKFSLFEENKYTSVCFIDRDSSNSSLFDENDPFSLIGLIRANCISDADYMSDLTHERLKAHESTMSKKIAPFDDVQPLVDEIGDPIVDTFPDGTLAYRYPAPDELFYDTKDISRLIIYQRTYRDNESRQKITSISHIGLAKKYPGNDKFDIVMKIPYSVLFNSVNFGAYKQVSDALLLKLIADNNNCAKKNDEIPQHFLYMPTYFNFLLQSQVGKTDAYEHVDYPFINFTLSHFYSFYEVAPYFDSANYILGEISTIPLTDEYGDPLIKKNERGEEEYSYPPADTLVCLLQPNPNKVTTYLKYSVQNIDGKGLFVPTDVVYTVTTKEGKYAYCMVNIENLPKELKNVFPFEKTVVHVKDLKWKNDISTELVDKRAFALNKKKDIKALNREFNLDNEGGWPFNLLDVCVTCRF